MPFATDLPAGTVRAVADASERFGGEGEAREPLIACAALRATIVKLSRWGAERLPAASAAMSVTR